MEKGEKGDEGVQWQDEIYILPYDSYWLFYFLPGLELGWGGGNGLIEEMKHVWRAVVIEKARFSSNPCYYMNETVFFLMPFLIF